MTDRHGTTLKSGDPVLYRRGDDTVSATVIAETASGYLIQLDQRGPRTVPTGLDPSTTALIDQVHAATRNARDAGIDVQEPFAVTGDELEYFADWPDDDKDVDDRI